MNWDTQLNSILNDTDCNVAKIKQRLSSTGYYAKVGLLDMVDTKNIRFNEPLSVSMEHTSCSDVFSRKLPKEELMSISRQLQFQGKTIESLQQALLRVETEKEQQRQKIQSLEEEIRRLQNQSEERSLDFQLERKMEDWRKEMSNEIYSLREQIRHMDRRLGYGKLTFSSLMQEVHERKRDLCEEHESLRKEIDNMKHKLWRQEDELLKQISDTKELKHSQDKNSKIVRELMNKYQWLAHERECSGQELTHIRSTVGGLKEQLRNVQLADNQTSTPLRPDARKQHRMKKKPKAGPLNEDSDSNLSCTLSLADVSSDDDFSALQNLDLDTPVRKDGRYSSTLGTRENEREAKTNDSDEDVSVDLEGLSDSPPELNLSDLS
ncbi:cyclin-dependent kinase 11A [Pristis pectinata]|uniref:cyclin-dependent kinase 11A n=1 Tax=Pristis pectinata TaxID=685728 RepID=UPI00223D6AF9|nr:cyclin-dependent kinase 11A [Pristis pectinata]